MPASIPINNTTTLTHIINDPIIGLSLSVYGFCRPSGGAGSSRAVLVIVT
jgi:hypothetical protein